MIGQSLGALLGGLDIPPAVTVAVTTVGVLLVATIVQMVFGELYPKNLAIAAPETLALALARSTQIYLAVFGWLIAIFDVAANLFLRPRASNPSTTSTRACPPTNSDASSRSLGRPVTCPPTSPSSSTECSSSPTPTSNTR